MLFILDRMLAIPALVNDPNANPWDEDDPLESLMTTGCHCKGSDELDNLFKCRYTSVPYLKTC